MKKRLLIASAVVAMMSATASVDAADIVTRSGSHDVVAGLDAAAPVKTYTKFKKPGRKSDGLRWTPFVERTDIRTEPRYRSLMKYAPGGEYTMPGYAAVVYSYKWEEIQESRQGIYEIPTSGAPESLFPVVLGDEYAGNSGAVYVGGKFFVAIGTVIFNQVADMTYYIYNAETWELERTVPGDLDFFAVDMTADPTSDKVYGWFINSEEQYYYFGSFDINTFEVTEIKNYGVDLAIYGIAAAADGSLYGMSNDGYLYAIDKTSGDATMVGSNGLFTDYMTSAAIDARSGKMYYATSTAYSGELYEIDLSNGYATLVYNFPGNEEITGFYIPTPDVAGGAPAAARSLSTEFADGSLTGNVLFTAPTLNYNNVPGNGSLSYRVTLNGVEAATGTTAYGATETVAVTAPASGQYTVGVTFSNAVGQGPVAVTHLYIGHDSPSDVKNVALGYADGQFTLTWEAPTAVNGGFINPDNVTYTIVRYPGEVTVATAHKGTLFTEPVAEPETRVKYFYTVAAAYEGVTSKPVASNVYTLGSVVPPFRCDFNDPAALDDFTIIDANDDGKVWEWVNGEMKVTYNSMIDTDDYLVLPPVKLQQGMTYSIAFDVKAQWDAKAEKIAVYVGKVPSVDGLSTELLAPTVISNTVYTTREVYFVPETTDTYFFAIKGCSDADSYYLCVDNVSVSAPLEAMSPAAPTGLTVTPGKDGALTADITFVAPELTILGTRLEAIDRVEISRGDEVIATLNVAPGETGHYVDNSPSNGFNNYSVAAFNSTGRGAEAMTSVYVGVYAPQPVQVLTAMHGNTDGQVYLGWDHPARDIKDTRLNASQLTYDIYRRLNGSVTLVAEGISGTSFIDQAIDDDAEQAFVYYVIIPSTAGGSGDGTLSELLPVGAPYQIPFVESFAGYTMNHIFGIEQPDENYGDWGVANDRTIDGFKSQDNDNGYMLFTGTYKEATATIISGRVAIGTAPNPEFSFYYYTYGANNSFDIQINAGQGFRTVRTVSLGGEDNGWVKCSVSLSAYIGRDIQFALVGHIDDRMYIAFDNLRVGSVMENNLYAESISAPSRVKAGETVKIDVAVKNDGTAAAEGFAVELYRNGILLETARPEAIAPDTRAIVSFDDVTNPSCDARLEYQAKIVYDKDEYAGDNVTDVTGVDVEFTNYPVPEGLGGSEANGTVALTWSEPDLDSPMLNILTDGAEDYKTFSIGLPSTTLSGDNTGDWTMVDADGLYTYVISVGGESLSYPNSGAPKSFEVFASGDINFNNPAWGAHSGEKMFVCMAAEPAEGKHNDDWMISPLLSGAAQTVSFYAKSVTVQYGADKLEVLYSTGGKEIKDFVKVGQTISTTDNWTEYTFDIPEGAKYFALRCVSDDTFALCVDDITYSAAGGDEIDLSLIGYNIYRDGVRLNDTPVEEPEFTDTTATGKHVYVVTAVYASGESRASAPFTIDLIGGVDGVGSDSFSVGVIGHTIVVTGAAGEHVAVHGIDGRTVASGIAADEMHVDVQPALYIVTVGQTSVKVAVK